MRVAGKPAIEAIDDFLGGFVGQAAKQSRQPGDVMPAIDGQGHEPAAGLQDALDLAEKAHRSGDVLEDPAGNDQIAGPVRKGDGAVGVQWPEPVLVGQPWMNVEIGAPDLPPVRPVAGELAVIATAQVEHHALFGEPSAYLIVKPEQGIAVARKVLEKERIHARPVPRCGYREGRFYSGKPGASSAVR